MLFSLGFGLPKLGLNQQNIELFDVLLAVASTTPVTFEHGLTLDGMENAFWVCVFVVA